MRQSTNYEYKHNEKSLSNQVRALINNEEYDACYELIVEEMKKSPHAPEPHNLLGMLLEKRREHVLAMKHFRVAWDLDPTYLPARHNLELYGSFTPIGVGAFDEGDCPSLEKENLYNLEYDQNKIGHVVKRRRKNEN